MTPDPRSARFTDEPQLRELHGQLQAPAPMRPGEGVPPR